MPCRVSDPNANVTLINQDTKQTIPAVYDSQRGFLGIFTAGTYVCRAVVNGKVQNSEEYIVHGWTGKGTALNRVIINSFISISY